MRDMSEDWEQDIIEWVGDRKVKQLNKLSWRVWIKYIGED